MSVDRFVGAVVRAAEKAATQLPSVAEGVVLSAVHSRGGHVVTVSCRPVIGGDIEVPQDRWCSAFRREVADAIATAPVGFPTAPILEGWRVLMGFPDGVPHVIDRVGA